MSKKKIILIGVLLLVLFTGSIVFNVRREKSKDQIVPASPGVLNPSELVVKTGKIGCLERKDKNGPQNMSCAIGLIGDDGKAYALQDDSTNASVGDIRVEIVGILGEPPAGYTAAGTIVVKSARPL